MSQIQNEPTLDEVLVGLIAESRSLQYIVGFFLLLVLLFRLRQIIAFIKDFVFGDIDTYRVKFISDQSKLIDQQQDLIADYMAMLERRDQLEKKFTEYQSLIDSMDKTEPNRDFLNGEQDRDDSSEAGLFT